MLYPPNTDTLDITKFRKDGGAEGMRGRREKKKDRNYTFLPFTASGWNYRRRAESRRCSFSSRKDDITSGKIEVYQIEIVGQCVALNENVGGVLSFHSSTTPIIYDGYTSKHATSLFSSLISFPCISHNRIVAAPAFKYTVHWRFIRPSLPFTGRADSTRASITTLLMLLLYSTSFFSIRAV